MLAVGAKASNIGCDPPTLQGDGHPNLGSGRCYPAKGPGDVKEDIRAHQRRLCWLQRPA